MGATPRYGTGWTGAFSDLIIELKAHSKIKLFLHILMLSETSKL